MRAADISLRIVAWPEARELVMPLRSAVFVLEQGVPPELELDEYDPVSMHAIAADETNTVVATGRLLPDGHIGRMAVARVERGRGTGALVLRALMEEARRRGFARVMLNAQVTAMSFYARHGFSACGPLFMDAGIEHQAMEKTF